MPNILIKDLNKIFPGNVHAVKDFNLEIYENEFLVLLGPSGCGKSTLLRMIAGLETITSGEIIIDGKVVNNIAPSDRNIALVFQNYALYSHMSIYENLGFSLMVAKEKSATIYNEVKKTQEKVQLTNSELRRKPAALSGGQRQRVALGRAITKKTDLLLMDEPLSNLDAKLRVTVRKEIISLFKNLKKTIIYVTHDQLEAMTMASRIVIMNDGIMQQVGCPLELYNSPNNLFVAQFLGEVRINTIDGIINNGIFSDGITSINLNNIDYHINKNNFKAVLAFRGENVTLSDIDNCDISAEIDFVEFLGSTQILHLRYNNSILRLKLPADKTFKVNSLVSFIIRKEKILIYDKLTEKLIKRNDNDDEKSFK